MLDIQLTCVYISCWYLLMQQCCDCLDWWLKPLPRETTSLKHVSKESWARCLLTCKEAWVWSFFVKYPSVIKHSNGKSTIDSLISISRWFSQRTKPPFSSGIFQPRLTPGPSQSLAIRYNLAEKTKALGRDLPEVGAGPRSDVNHKLMPPGW